MINSNKKIEFIKKKKLKADFFLVKKFFKKN